MPEMRIKLSTTQQAFCFDEHRYSLFLGGVGAGKSHAGAVKAMLQVFPNPPSLGMVVAPTYPMLRDATWRTAYDVWGPLIKTAVRNEMRMELVNGHEIIFRSADDPDRLRAINASWLWFDEAAMCHPDTWPIAIGRLRQGGRAGRAWVTTTPKGMNWLYEVFVVRATGETVVFRASTRSNPFLDTDYVDSLVSQYDGEFAKQELEAEFIADDAAALISYDWINAARMKEAVYAPALGPLVAGVDVSGPGEDETVCAVRQNGTILALRGFSRPDTRGDVLAMLRGFLHDGLSQVSVDTAGIGNYFSAHLRDNLPESVAVADVNVGEAPTSDQAKQKYANLKAELYWALRERFQEGEIRGLTDPLTISQLASLRYQHDPRGRVVIESKDQARKRGVKSPDRAEALMLAFAPESRDQMLAKAVASTAHVRAKPGEQVDSFILATQGKRGRGARAWGQRR